MNIALIEDEEAIRDLYKMEFQTTGDTLDGFATGGEGLAGLKKKPYDVILLDIMLPDINGLEVLKQIKQDSNLKNIPVMILSNLGQDVVIKLGFSLGANGYLIKSANSPKEVAQEVRSLMARQKTTAVS